MDIRDITWGMQCVQSLGGADRSAAIASIRSREVGTFEVQIQPESMQQSYSDAYEANCTYLF